MGTLEGKGYEFKSGNGVMIVLRNSKQIMQGVKRNNLYYLEADVVNDSDLLVSESYAVQNCSEASKWHRRLVHISEKGLQVLQSQGRLKGSGIFKLDACEVCVMGKSSKLPFKTSSYRATSCLEYVYCDLWGPTRQTTLGGARYFLSIMDDYSRKLWVFLLKSKTEAFEKFKVWSSEVENEKNRKIKCLKTDNSMESLSYEF